MRARIIDAANVDGMFANYTAMYVELGPEEKAALRQKFIDGEPTPEDCELLVRSNIMWIVKILMDFRVRMQVADMEELIAGGIAHAWKVAPKYHGGFAATTFYARVLYNWGRREIGQLTSQAPVAIPIACAQLMDWLYKVDSNWWSTEDSALAAVRSPTFKAKTNPSDELILRLRSAILSRNNDAGVLISRSYKTQHRTELRLTYGSDSVSVLLTDVVQDSMWAVARKGNSQRIAMGMLCLRLKGWTMQRIGDHYGVTKERIRQRCLDGMAYLRHEIVVGHWQQFQDLLPCVGEEFDGPLRVYREFESTQVSESA